MSETLLQFLFSVGIGLATLGGGLWFGIRTRVWKKQLAKIEAAIPPIPTDETRETIEQDLRDKINRQVGVLLLDRDKKIELLEKSDKEKQARIEKLENTVLDKDKEIQTLSGQVARLEREHEQEETRAVTAETRADRYENQNIKLTTKIEVYEVTLKLIQDLIARPTHITLSLDGVLAKEVVAEKPVLPEIQQLEVVNQADQNPS